MESDRWFVLNRGKMVGPYDQAQLVSMRSQGLCDSFTRVSCDQKQWASLDDTLRELNALASAPAPLRPPPLDGVFSPHTTTGAQRVAMFDDGLLVKPFPVVALLLLHFLTAGIFSFFWITGLHGKLPKIRTDDLSGVKAIGLCFVPFFNLYWIFIVYPRLCTRINALSRRFYLPPRIPVVLAYILCALILVPAAMATTGGLIMMLLFFSPTPKTGIITLFFFAPNLLTLINYLIVAPVLGGLIQQSVNHISSAQIAALRSNAA